MIELRAFQTGLYKALCQNGENRCFLKLCADDGALWVTDLPKRCAAPERVAQALSALPVICNTDEKTGLWRLDFTPEEWQRRLDALPCALPPIPKDEALHAAYALCRLLLAHPSPLCEQPLAMIRAVVKAAQGKRETLLRAVPVWQGEAAILLRRHKPMPSAAGRILAAWLCFQQPSSAKEENT